MTIRDPVSRFNRAAAVRPSTEDAGRELGGKLAKLERILKAALENEEEHTGQTPVFPADIQTELEEAYTANNGDEGRNTIARVTAMGRFFREGHSEYMQPADVQAAIERNMPDSNLVERWTEASATMAGAGIDLLSEIDRLDPKVRSANPRFNVAFDQAIAATNDLGAGLEAGIAAVGVDVVGEKLLDESVDLMGERMQEEERADVFANVPDEDLEGFVDRGYGVAPPAESDEITTEKNAADMTEDELDDFLTNAVERNRI